MSDSYYDVAQICGNGHVVNSMARDYPNSNQDYCSKCGTATITECPNCRTPIRGHYHVPGVIGFFDYSPPSFCFKCGSPFPWTSAALAAADELAEELDNLSSEERALLKRTVADLVREGPAARVAETRFKKIMVKVGREGYEAMRSILTDIVSETVRKTIFGPS
jgi:hypothetical protein